jgi:hypothetical protein
MVPIRQQPKLPVPEGQQMVLIGQQPVAEPVGQQL